MKYSFITPRPKRFISGEMRLSFFFFAVSIAMVVGAYLFLLYKTIHFKDEHASFSQTTKDLEASTDVLEKKIGVIDAEVKMHEQIATDNTVLKESIRNLFDLVPDQITLTRAELDEKSLILYGITPTKDTYNFMLQAPLKSIFSRTYTSFYPIENGWYSFVSSNYLDDETNTTDEGDEE
ncbi:MAG: hypothetical protein NTY39_06610 [Campylobacterales bacterium]|nr:hypothetical protein [Campylobacterales bacterium]